MNLIDHARAAAAKVKIPEKFASDAGEIRKHITRGFYFHAVAVSSPGNMRKKAEHYKKAAEVFENVNKKFPYRVFEAYAKQYRGYEFVVEAGKSATNESKAKNYKLSSDFFADATKLFRSGKDFHLSRGWSKLTLACSQDAMASASEVGQRKAIYNIARKNAADAAIIFRRLRVKKLEQRSKSLVLSSGAWMSAIKGDNVRASCEFHLSAKCIQNNPEWSNMADFFMAWSKWFAAQSTRSKKDLAHASVLFGKCGCREMKLACGDLLKNGL